MTGDLVTLCVNESSLGVLTSLPHCPKTPAGISNRQLLTLTATTIQSLRRNSFILIERIQSISF